jgi:putative exporter of polyketide antibiotics
VSSPEDVDADFDVLRSAGAGRKVIHGSALRLGASLASLVFALATATLLLRHLGVEESGRYVTVMSSSVSRWSPVIHARWWWEPPSPAAG